MSNLLKKDAANVLKGFSMGTGVFPGVSAGTIALITGIFQPLLDSLDALLTPSNWKMLLHGHASEFAKAVNLRFLLTVGIGTLAGFVLLARLVEYVLAHFPVQTWAFFFGLILVSTIWLLTDIKKWKVSDVLYLLSGIAIGVWLCLVSPTQTPDSMWYVALSGALGVVSMILPGISGSFILIMLGKYDYMLGAINNLEWWPLTVFVLGCGAGLVLFSKGLHWLLAHYERPTMLVLLGLVLGFLIKIWPWNDMEAIARADGLAAPAAGQPLHVPGAVIWFIIGSLLVCALYLTTRKSASR